MGRPFRELRWGRARARRCQRPGRPRCREHGQHSHAPHREGLPQPGSMDADDALVVLRLGIAVTLEMERALETLCRDVPAVRLTVVAEQAGFVAV